jgi:hypothetical protein
MQYEYKLYITQPENFPISTLNKRKRKREKKPKSLLNHLDVKANSREKKKQKAKANMGIISIATYFVFSHRRKKKTPPILPTPSPIYKKAP